MVGKPRAKRRPKTADDPLTARQWEVLDALLLTGNVAETAERVKADLSTIYTMLGREPVKSAYRRAREEASRAAIALLQSGMSDAARFLNSLVTDESAAKMVRLRAATKVLEFGIQGVSLDTMRAEIDEIKQALGERL